MIRSNGLFPYLCIYGILQLLIRKDDYMSRNSKSEYSRITVDIPKVDHKKLKAMAAIRGTSMRKIIIESIELYSENFPNEETIKAIREAEDEKNLVRAKDIKDFFKKLGI